MSAALALLAAALLLATTPKRATTRLAAVHRTDCGAHGQSAAVFAHDEVAAGGTDGRTTRRLLRVARRSRRADLRIAVRALAEDLDAGAPAADAWRRAATLAGSCAAGFREAARLIALGQPIDWAFADAPDPALQRLAAVWSSSAQSGAASAEVLRRWVEDADAREQADRARDVALAGPRASALLLAALPLFGLLLGVAMGADPIGALTGSMSGAALGLAGVALDVLGVLWMLRLITVTARR